jgi:hypothetical protein
LGETNAYLGSKRSSTNVVAWRKREREREIRERERQGGKEIKLNADEKEWN